MIPTSKHQRGLAVDAVHFTNPRKAVDDPTSANLENRSNLKVRMSNMRSYGHHL